MLLALVLTMMVLPAAASLAYIARTDLAAALDDCNRTKALYAAQGAMTLVGADLDRGGDGQITWPEPSTDLEIFIQGETDFWKITVAVRCGRARVEKTAEIPKSD